MNFKSVFQNLFAPSSYLGIDIGTTSIKMVELSRSVGFKFKLKNYGLLESYGHLERLNDAIQTSSLKIFEKETISLLNTLLEKTRPSTNKVVASIPAFSSFVTLLNMPEMGDEETAKSIPFQARQYIPLPVEEVAIDWIKAGTIEDEKGNMRQQVLLISVPKEQIKRYQEIFKAVGLDLVYLETEGQALTRVLIDGDPTPTLIVDVGSRSTSIMITDGGNVKVINQTDFAGGTLTQALSGGLNIDIHRAEELKKTVGLSGPASEHELSTLLLPYIDAIIGEVTRLRDRYENEAKHKVERVVLTGGTEGLAGIGKYFEEQLMLPVVKANPFSKLDYPPELEPMISMLGSTFSVAIGLAIRGFS